MPALPRPRLAVVAEEVTAVPAADPDCALAVAPSAPGARVLHWRLQHLGLAGLEIDPAEIAPRERGVEDLAVRRGGNAVGPDTLGRVEHGHCGRFRLEPTIDAILAGEPERALAIESGGVEVGAAALLRQREYLDLARIGIDADDRVLAAIGHPGSTIGSHDHAMRGGAAAERDQVRLPGLRIEPPELARRLCREPHRAV